VSDAKRKIEIGSAFPYDAPDAWWWVATPRPALPPSDWAHAAARGVMEELQGRVGIKHIFEDVEEDVRVDIVESIAAIIRAARP